MIIWQGLGWLGVVLPVIFCVLMTLVVEAIAGKGYTAQHSWPTALGTLLGAVSIWLLSIRLSKDAPARILIDPRTGEQVAVRKSHSLFFLPLKYISIALVVIAFVLLFVNNHSSH